MCVEGWWIEILEERTAVRSPVPAAATTAVHVPLGVGLAVHAAVLAVLVTTTCVGASPSN